MVEKLVSDVLVVGGSTGGTVAAIQAARRGVKTILASEFSWLGGMLSAAGVCAPDGNELVAFQTGIWGAFLEALRREQRGGLDNSWVSMFSYHPHTGAKVFAEWVQQLPNLQWISGKTPLEVFKSGNRIVGVRFEDLTIEAEIVVDATELGDLLALAEIPCRWGWEFRSEFDEPSAPVASDRLTEKYPVQAPTWVFLLQDYGQFDRSPAIPPSLLGSRSFAGAWEDYGAEKFLNYGRLSEGLFMMNWPICGNDYGEGLERTIASGESQKQFLREAYWHSLEFARYIQSQLGRRYGLARNIFAHPQTENNALDSAFALYPYYRESRRLQGLVTVTENDILPVEGARVAKLPLTESQEVSSIAIGNYPNDHHYPGMELSLKPKSIRWGGRWSGTPFTIPYGALVPREIEGLLACEKNISVSHIANGSTRLQPVVMNIAQAAGMAAALCVELKCMPGQLPLRNLQEALLKDPFARAAVVPLFNLHPRHPDWLEWQLYYLDHPDLYPLDGNAPIADYSSLRPVSGENYTGIFQRIGEQSYKIILTSPTLGREEGLTLVTLDPEVDRQLQSYPDGSPLSVLGRWNAAGDWLLVEKI